MKFEVKPDDPMHNQIDALWTKLAAHDLMTPLIVKAEKTLPRDKQEQTPAVLIGAMRRWLTQIDQDGETIEDYSGQEIATRVGERMKAVALRLLKPDRDNPPGDRGSWRK